MLRASDNPSSQYPEEAQLDLIEGLWWVVHTKPRQEKALARDLLRSSIPYFLPMYEAIRRSRGRAWKTVLPLFPGYLFLCCSDEGRTEALKTNRIAGLIDVADQARLIEELSSIQRLLASKLAVDPYPTLKQGAACRIRRGSLAGLEGRVERRKGHVRFIVNVTILGQGAMVEIDADMLEPCA